MKRKIQALVIGMIFTFGCTNLMAQDPHFSQFNASPLVLNPGMTGVFSGNYRITAIYRSQWSSILKDESVPMFRTFAGSIDFRVGGNTWGHHALGVGVAFMTDKAGEAEFGTNEVYPTISGILALNKSGSHFISVGLQAGIAQRSINYNNLRFGNQFDGTGFNANLPSGEDPSNFNDHYVFFSANAGVFWYYFPKKRINYYAGVAVSHLNRPNQAFYGGETSKLFMKITGSAGLQAPLGEIVDILPSVLVMSQGPALETSVGTYIKLLFERNNPQGNAFYIGPWYRIVRGEDKAIASEALILATRFDYASFTVGFSYDLNFSELTEATNTRGGFEVSAAHIGSWNKKNKVLYCPRF